MPNDLMLYNITKQGHVHAFFFSFYCINDLNHQKLAIIYVSNFHIYLPFFLVDVAIEIVYHSQKLNHKIMCMCIL